MAQLALVRTTPRPGSTRLAHLAAVANQAHKDGVKAALVATRGSGLRAGRRPSP